MVAFAVQIGPVAFFLAGFAAVLSPLAALRHHALAGRVRAFLRVWHRNLLISLYVPAPGMASAGVATAELSEADTIARCES